MKSNEPGEQPAAQEGPASDTRQEPAAATRAAERLSSTASDLASETRALVREEVDLMAREVASNAGKSLPVLARFGLALLLGLFATASSYRLVLRVFERVFGPALAAALCTAGFGAGSALLARKAWTERDRLKLLVPRETLEATKSAARAHVA